MQLLPFRSRLSILINELILPNQSARAGATNGRILPTSSSGAVRDLQIIWEPCLHPFTSLFLLPFSPLCAAAGCSNVFPWGGEQRVIAPLCSPERQKGNQSQNRTPDNNAQGRSRRQPHQPPHPSPGGGGEGHPGREHCSSAPGVSPGGGGFGANVHSCTVCFHNPPLQLQEGKAGGNHRCACSLPPRGLVPIPA